MQERQSEDADEPMGGMRSDAPTSQVDAQRHLDDFHQPHQRDDNQRDDEAAQKLFSFLFVIHAFGFIKNRSAAKVGKNGSV